MREILLAMTLLVLMIGPTMVMGSEDHRPTTDLVLVFDVPTPVMTREGGVMWLTVDGWSECGGPGETLLPERTFHIPIGNDLADMIGYEIVDVRSIKVKGPFATGTSPSNGDSIGSVDRSTSDMVTSLGTLKYGSVNYLQLRLAPFSLEGGRLSHPSKLVVHIDLSNSSPGSDVRIDNDLPMAQENDGSVQLPIWIGGAAAAPEPSGSYHNSRPPIEMVIITSSTYNSTFQRLADWKTQKGIPTTVVETGWIYGQYSGTDNQDEIRDHLIALYKNEALKWVVLAGDHDTVPSRLAYVPDGYADSGSDTAYASTDAYYADLDGTGHTPYDWDGDNDGNFGEYSVDGIDLSAEVYVGRISGGSVSQMAALVDDIIDYETTPPSGGWTNRSVLAGAYSNYRTSSSYNDTTDEADLKEAIRLDFMNTGAYNTYTLYEQTGIWPSQRSSNASLTYTNVVSAIDPGAFMVNMAGHGSSTGIYRKIWNSDSDSDGLCDSGETTDTAYYSNSASQSNGERKPLFYNDACNNGDFDRTTCLTEDILSDVGIGSIGASRVSWYAVHWTKGSDGGYYNQGHDYRFWQQFFNSGNQQPGKSLYLSKSDYINDKTAHDREVWKNLLQYNLMGDPEIPIWTQKPRTLNLSYPVPLPGNGNVTITVKDPAGTALSGARVCLMNGSVFYGVSTTDAQGKAVVFIPSVTMDMTLTVTCKGFLPSVRTVGVGQDTDPPEILSMVYSGMNSTGDAFAVTATITDVAGIGDVWINRAYSSSQPTVYDNSSMTGSGGTFVFEGVNPIDSVLPFWYRIVASDVRGNVNVSAWRSKSIRDDDRPVIVRDNSDPIATTGDLFMFNVNITDNILVSRINVNVTLDGITFSNFSMCGANPYNLGLYIPSGAIGTMTYVFHAVDQSGNRVHSADITRSIVDNDAPVLVTDLSGPMPTTGDLYTFSMIASDNIGLDQVRIEYSVGDSMAQDRSMSYDGMYYNHSQSIPNDEEGTISYRFMMEDLSGNRVWTNLTTLTVIDNDQPFGMTDLTTGLPTTGDPFRIRFTAEDNIALGDCFVEHGFEGSEMVRTLAKLESGRYVITVDVPEDSVSALNYRFVAVDTSGNENLSEERTLEVMDDDPPEMVWDLSDIEATTGDGLVLTYSLRDNIGIDNATVLWSLRDRGGSVILDGPYGDPVGQFTGSIPVPNDILGSIDVRLSVMDISGNIMEYEPDPIVVTDDDPPGIVNLTVPPLATTGDRFAVEAYLFDNTAVREADLEVDISGTVMIIPMDRMEGKWSAWIDIPEDVVGEFLFRLVLRDPSGNQWIDNWYKGSIEDDDAPTLLSTGSMGSLKLTTGDTFEVFVKASDNIGVDSVVMTLISGGSEMRIEGIPEGDGHSISFRMWDHVVGGVSVLIEAIDGSGNIVNRSFKLTIKDNDPPSPSIAGPDGPMQLSGSEEFTVQVNDNIAPGSLTLHAVKGSVNRTLVVAEGVYTFEPTSPGDWTLLAIAIDAAGNMGSVSRSITVIDDGSMDPVIKDIPSAVKGHPLLLETESREGSAYEWTITAPDGKQTKIIGSSAEFLPAIAGDHAVTLTATGPDGYSTVAVSSFTVDGDEERSGFPISVLLVAAIVLAIIVVVSILVLVIIRKRKASSEQVMARSSSGKGAVPKKNTSLKERGGSRVVLEEEEDVWG